MNKEILNKFIEKTVAYLNSAEAFIDKNVPSYIEELLNYRMYEESFDLLWSMPLFLIGMLVAYFMFIDKGKDGKTCVQTHPDNIAMAVLLITISFTIGSIMFMVSLLDVIKICIAPKVYLLEYVRLIL